jgi:ribose transport system ATP-binding protein
MSEEMYRVEMYNIYKSFEGVKALHDMNLCVRPGEVHALMGENGAGKSTLIRCLSGAHSPDSGDILTEGEHVHFRSPCDGINRGISVIYQEFALIPHLTVAENVMLDSFRDHHGLINWNELYAQAQKSLEDIGFGNIDVHAKVRDLSVAYQQAVEICKALYRQAKVLVLDEPTAVMTDNEVKQLFKLIKQLKDRNVSVIYISHRLDEVFQIADRITVMKDGQYVTTVSTGDIDKKKLVSLMVGREMATYYPKRNSNIGEVVLTAEHIKAGMAVKDISFDVREGEIVGLSGLVGSGRTEAVRAMLGADKLDGGMVTLRGQKVTMKTMKDAYQHGIGYLSEDRKNQGILLRRPIYQNITLTSLKKISKAGWVNRKNENSLVGRYIKGLSIKTSNPKNNTESLSGGNQQKVAVAKILAADTKVIFLDEPTRGVDVGAKEEIFNIINDLVAQRYAVVIISSEMEEIIGMCDRAFIIREGKSVKELQKDELNEINIIQYAMGVKTE